MRAAQKIIDTNALSHNLKTLSALAPHSKCIAVVKANAYGCEVCQILPALESADLLAVACIEEAIAIRQAGYDKAILLLEGVFEAAELTLCAQQNFEVVVATQTQLQWLLSLEHTFPRLWFKLDTGMGRLGFQRHDASSAIEQLLKRYRQEQMVLITHFSDADTNDRDITERQIQVFDQFAQHYPHCEQCLCNSAGILAYPEAHRDYIRPGIALYGVSPFEEKTGQDHGLQPVMQLQTRVLSVKDFTKGESIGYGSRFTMPSAGKIAICEIGYADGYLRFIPENTPVLIAGKSYPLVGRIAMNMISVFVDENVNVGDEVVCWGKALAVEKIAKAANTIPYQLLTAVSERLKKQIKS